MLCKARNTYQVLCDEIELQEKQAVGETPQNAESLKETQRTAQGARNLLHPPQSPKHLTTQEKP